MGIFEHLFDPSGLTPHGFCLTWDPGLLWLDAGSDSLIFLAYFSIPLSLISLARRRADLRPKWLAGLFAAFILACGSTHALSIVTIWFPLYRLDGAVRLVTAVLSVLTAATLHRLIPRLLALPSHDDMARLNSDLHRAFVEQQNIACELREKKRWLLMAQEAGHIGSWRLDAKGEIVHWSGAQYALYGLAAAAEQLTRARWFDRVAPDDRNHLTASLSRALTGDGEYEAEFRITLTDGTQRWISEHGRIVSGTTDEAPHLVGVSVDVTDRIRLTAHLTETNQRLFDRAAADSYAHQMAAEQMRVLFEHSPDALFVLQVDAPDEDSCPADAGFVMEAINPATTRMLGMAPAQVVGRPVEQIHAPEVVDELLAAYRTCLARNTVTTITIHRMIPGKQRVFDVTLSPVTDPRDGRVSRIIGVARDMTERTEVERRMRQLAKMEATHRLTAGVAHDFNNMLQALMGGLELLQVETEAGQAREYAEIALNAARRGAAMTQRLLAFTRQQTLQPRHVNAGRLIANIKSLLAPTLGPKITLRVAPTAAAVITLADPGQLEAALVNLVVNASDALPNGGQIEIGASVATHLNGLDLPRGTYAVLTVSDTGTGMTQEVLQQACDPFFTTKGLGGSGLGLSMVQGFARQSGGDLCIDSEPGRGTCVQIWLPLAAAPLAQESGPLHILLVDDAADVLVTAGAFLRHAGFQVTRVGSGQQALAFLATGANCDAIVTDFAMPDMNGMDLLRDAREMRAGIPGLIITGLDRTAMGAHEFGARVLQKPFSRQSLIDEVCCLVDRVIA